MKPSVRWALAPLYAVVGIVLVGLLALGVVIATFNHADYRQTLTGAVNLFTGGRLTVAGDFRFSPSLAPSLEASGVRFVSAEGAFALRTEQLRLQVDLLPLLHGTVWVKELSMSGVTADVEARSEEPKALKAPTFVPVVERLLLSDISISYRVKHDAEPRVVSIEEFRLEESSKGAPLRILGQWELAGTAYRLSGDLGSLQTLVAADAPFPVNLKVASPLLNVTVSGHVGDVLHGQGITLELSSQAPDIAQLVRPLGACPRID